VTEGLFKRGLVRPILELLKQGVTPEKIALSIALGAALGVFPVIGSTTVLCAIAAIVLRLNLPAIQIVNYFLYPAQIALLVPFFRLGEKLFRAPRFPVSVAQIHTLFQASTRNAVTLLWTTTWHAIVVWSLPAPVFVAIVFLELTPILRRVLRRQTEESNAPV
jgi:uncharacterized protein (DUF2062 family)